MKAAARAQRRTRPMLLFLAMMSASGSLAATEVYQTYAPVTHVEPVVERRSVPVQEDVCTSRPSSGQRELDRDLAGDVEATEPGLGLTAAIRRDNKRRETRNLIQHCRTETRYESREEVVAYRVVYRYRGRDYVRRMQEHPGERVRVEVRVQPYDSWRAGSPAREFWPPN